MSESVDPTCMTCGLDRTRAYRPNEPDYARWKRQRMYPPCWKCEDRDVHGKLLGHTSPTGCATCADATKPASLVCSRCGSYITRNAFVWHGSQLPPEVFERYPASYRLAFWAVHGAPSQARVGQVRTFLRQERNAKFVAMMREQLGLTDISRMREPGEEG